MSGAGRHAGGVPQPRRHPIERFLGEEEAAGGPFALLGLSTDACSEELVLSALDRQIERIAQHPECDTPEADEVRLALHAAAAQLLDPAVRRHLIARWSGRPPADVDSESHDAPTPKAPLPSAKLLEHDAILTLGIFGGWNQRSLRRLLSIAHARGFDNAQVAATLRALAATRRSTAIGAQATKPAAIVRPATPPPPIPTAPLPELVRAPLAPHQPPAPAASPAAGAQPVRPAPGAASRSAPARSSKSAPPSNEPLEEEMESGQTLILRVAIFTLVGAVAVGFCAAIILWVVSLPSPDAPSLPGGEEEAILAEVAPLPAEAQRSEREPVETVEPAPAPRRIDPQSLPQEIAASAEALDLNASAAAERIAGAIRMLAARWPELSPDLLVACHNGLVEFIYLAGGRLDVISATVDIIAAGSRPLGDAAGQLEAHEVLPAIWSVGMLSRLTREKDLALTVRLSIESRLISAFGTAAPAIDRTFQAGASAALLRIPQRLIPKQEPGTEQGAPIALDSDAWKSWADAVDAFAASDRALRNRMLLAGLEMLLIKGPEPNVNRSTGDVVADLVLRLEWRDGDESRRWLIRSFGDRLVSNADLHAVTSALATRSAAEGVDLTMVLSTSAADRVRADLRERFASTWGVTDLISREETSMAWISRARELLEEPFAAQAEIDLLARAALFARLNEAAHLQWRGDQEEAASILTELDLPINAAMSPTRPPAGNVIDRSSRWAERYAAARQSIRARRELIDELARFNTILGDVDAAILVQEATAGTPPEIRQLALDAVKRSASNPAVINALLDRLPRMPRIPSNSVLIEAVCGRGLPPVRDESWPVEARRALVECLLESISVHGPMNRLDGVENVLAESYQTMSGIMPLPSGRPGQAQAYATAAQTWSMWRSAAEPLIPSVSPPLSLSQIERRRTGRLAHARGPVQLFSAEQVSICELLAYLVTCERPGRADAIRQTMQTLAQERRSAGHIFNQMIAVERAIAQLWLIRIEAEDPA